MAWCYAQDVFTVHSWMTVMVTFLMFYVHLIASHYYNHAIFYWSRLFYWMGCHKEHIQRLEAREQEREARERGHSRCNPSQEKQTPKIPMFKGQNDPNIYIEWEQKVDQIFTIHVVSDQKQVDFTSTLISTPFFAITLKLKQSSFVSLSLTHLHHTMFSSADHPSTL